MAFGKLKMKHPQTNEEKTISAGFSWLFFFFGPILSIISGLWLQLVIILITVGLANFYYMFTHNRAVYKKLLSKGFEPIEYIGDEQKIKYYFDK